MTGEPNLCRTCKSEAALSKIETFSGEEHGVTLTITNLPILLCQKGHRRFLYPELPIHLMEALLRKDDAFGAPSAKEKGFFRKHLHCPACDEALPSTPGGTATLKKSIELNNVAPFETAIDVPKWTCAKCGKEAIGPAEKIGQDVMHAASLAFRGAELPPG